MKTFRAPVIGGFRDVIGRFWNVHPTWRRTCSIRPSGEVHPHGLRLEMVLERYKVLARRAGARREQRTGASLEQRRMDSQIVIISYHILLESYPV